MPGLAGLFDRLNLNSENGLFTLSDIKSNRSPFPFRISHVLKDVLQPSAILGLYQGEPSQKRTFKPVNNPLVLFFDNPSEQKRAVLARQCFSFSQANAVIITNADGAPEIFHGYNFSGNSRDFLQQLNADIDLFSLEKLASGETWNILYDDYYKDVRKVDRWLLNNVVDARRLLVSTDVGNLPYTIANRLIGRLLFVRYLIDRNVQFRDQNFIVGGDKIEKANSLNGLLLDKSGLYSFFEYITDKFEGDLFPIQTRKDINHKNELEYVNDNHLNILNSLFSCSNFFVGQNVKGYSVQPSLFDVYDFEVIPVELISNIYENFLGNTENEENERKALRSFESQSRQSEIKAYYTPPYMVDYVLSQTVDKKLQNDDNGGSAVVLDPSCGSGIFLVETVRKLIQHHLDGKGGASDTTISNHELWDIVRDNIYGIDIDDEAIEITIFSLYITLLDYRTPIEIENFKFQTLKGTNLFNGLENDFFNIESQFQKPFDKVNFDFIIGNPPWGKVSISTYKDYIGSLDRSAFPVIGNQEISQAFLIRVKDFMRINTQAMLIVTGKVLYNTEVTKQWRQWFLTFYELIQVTELSPVNNKVTGGPEIFEGAKQSPAILHFKTITDSNFDYSNKIKHITFRPNNNFLQFKAITVNRKDIKYVPQKSFIESRGGNDWLWKILVHGSFFDFDFIKRLKDKHIPLYKLLEINEFAYNGGLKYKDGDKRCDADEILDFDFLELQSRKEFKQFDIKPSLTLRKQLKKLRNSDRPEDLYVGYVPNAKYFKRFKLLCKKGLEVRDDFKGVAAISAGPLAFPSSVMAIIPEGETPTNEQINILWNVSGLFNSTLFSYYVFCTSSSAGIDRTRIYFDEFLNFPIVLDDRIGKQARRIQTFITENSDFMISPDYQEALNEEFQKLNALVNEAYGLSCIEQSLIDYAIKVAIPSFRRVSDPINSLRGPVKKKHFGCYLQKYANVFVKHFSEVGPFKLEASVSFGNHFAISLFKFSKSGDSYVEHIESTSDLLNSVGSLTISKISRGIYLNSDLRGFGKDFFYIIKPVAFKYWHEALAHEDLAEVVKAINQAH